MMSEFPDPETVRAVLTMATQAPSVHNSQPWYWWVGGESLHLYADPSRHLPRTDPDRRDLLVSCGAALHHCTVALAATGWHATVHRLPDPADPDHLAAVTVEPQSPDELDVMLAAAVGRRRTDRRTFSSWPVPWGDIALMGARAARAGVMLRQIDLIPQLSAIVAEAVTPDAPIPARIFADPALQQQAPGTPDNGVVLALGTERDDGLARLRAGEATSLVLLSATAMGLATCPLTDPLNDMRARLGLACEVFDGEAHPQALIRLGPPPADGVPRSPTGRRPTSETTTWTN